MGRKHSEETKRKISETKRGQLNPMYGTIAPNRLLFITRDELYEQFVMQGHNLRWIAEKHGVTYRTVQSWLRKYDIRLTPLQHGSRISGPKNGNFTGRKDNHGYIYVVNHEHPACTRDGYVPAHRVVVEAFIGRLLTQSEQVHHLNFEKADNDIGNLMLFASAADHTAFHAWMDRVGAFSLGLLPKPPATLVYAEPVLLRGKWMREIAVSSFWVIDELAA